MAAGVRGPGIRGHLGRGGGGGGHLSSQGGRRESGPEAAEQRFLLCPRRARPSSRFSETGSTPFRVEH